MQFDDMDAPGTHQRRAPGRNVANWEWHKQGMKTRNTRFRSRGRIGVGVLALLLVPVSAVSPAQVAAALQALEWKGIAPRYNHFDEIKPVLINRGKKSVFLSRIWPHGSAQLQRFNDADKKWESGNWSGGCGTVKDAFVPIELAAHSERSIYVFWQLSTDDWDTPKYFVVGSSDTRPLPGKYRLMLRYSLRPWTVGQSPGTIFLSTSPEFFIAD
jgi:hypothetical protein